MHELRRAAFRAYLTIGNRSNEHALCVLKILSFRIENTNYFKPPLVQLFRDNDKMLEMPEFHLGALCPAISSRDRSDLCYLLDASATFSHSQTVRDRAMAALCHGRQMQR